MNKPSFFKNKKLMLISSISVIVAVSVLASVISILILNQSKAQTAEENLSSDLQSSSIANEFSSEISSEISSDTSSDEEAIISSENSSEASKPSSKASSASSSKQSSSTKPSTSSKDDSSSALSSAQLSTFADEITRLTNQHRKTNELSAFKTNKALTGAAVIRGKEQITLFGHDRPDGSDCFTVFDNLNYNDKAIKATNFGENVAYVSNSYSKISDSLIKEMAQRMFEGWKNSEGHNKNMLSPDFDYMGVGIAATISDSDYGYKVLTIYGAQLFLR